MGNSHYRGTRRASARNLCHEIGDKVEAAYRRGDLFEKRRLLMAEWACYCGTSGAADLHKVVALRRGGRHRDHRPGPTHGPCPGLGPRTGRCHPPAMAGSSALPPGAGDRPRCGDADRALTIPIRANWRLRSEAGDPVSSRHAEGARCLESRAGQCWRRQLHWAWPALPIVSLVLPRLARRITCDRRPRRLGQG
jgi:hypothetical protein